MADLPRWVWVAVPLALVSVAGIAYVANPDVAGRADDCLGNTTPIERGAMVNRCDYVISVVTCLPDGEADSCVTQEAKPEARFEVRADVPVIAHACRAPYTAIIKDGSVSNRGCLASE